MWLAFVSPLLPLEFGPPFLPSVAKGVGQYPYSLSDVRRPGIVSAQHAPFRIEPHRGQITEDDVQSSKSEHWGVLHEDVAWSHLTNDPGKFSPEAAAPPPSNTRAFPGGGDVLAGEPAADDIDKPSPGGSVKGANVIPHREPGKDSVSLALEEDSPRVFLQLNGADAHMAAKESSKDSAPGSGEEVQFTKW